MCWRHSQPESEAEKETIRERLVLLFSHMALVNKLGLLFLPELEHFLCVFPVTEYNRVKQKESQIETPREIKKTLTEKKKRKVKENAKNGTGKKEYCNTVNC